MLGEAQLLAVDADAVGAVSGGAAAAPSGSAASDRIAAAHLFGIASADVAATGGSASGPVPPFAPGILGAKGSLYVTRQTLFTHIATREGTQQMADDLFAVVSSGQVKIRIDQRYPLDQVAQAHRDLEARKTTGSTVLIP